MSTLKTEDGVRYERVVEDVVIDRETVIGYGFLIGEADISPMGSWPDNYPMEPLVTGTLKNVLEASRIMDRFDEVQHRSLYVRGERIGWVPLGMNYYVMEDLRKVASGKKKRWTGEFYRLVPAE